MSAALAPRVLARVQQNGPTPCWLWPGALDEDGYGIIMRGRPSRRKARVHRVVYEHFVGPIPAGLTIDHTCHNGSDCAGGKTCVHRRCVNPAHLEAVTRGENVLRGRGFGAANAAKTHCLNGHEFTPENTRVYTNVDGTHRACLRCRQERRAVAA